MARRRKRQSYHNLPATHPVFRPYATVIGQILIAWNALNENLAISYCAVMGGGYVNLFLASWHAINVDRVAREMLLSAMKNDLNWPEPPPIYAEYKWICDEANRREDDRNNAIHSPLWAWEYNRTVMPETGLGHVRAKKLTDQNLLAHFRWLRDTIMVLSDYARDLNDERRSTLPERPPLPAHPNPSERKQHPQAQPAKRQPPPRSSPA